jgi:hypothetical protein
VEVFQNYPEMLLVIHTGQAWKICLSTVGIEPTTFGILAQPIQKCLSRNVIQKWTSSWLEPFQKCFLDKLTWAYPEMFPRQVDLKVLFCDKNDSTTTIFMSDVHMNMQIK